MKNFIFTVRLSNYFFGTKERRMTTKPAIIHRIYVSDIINGVVSNDAIERECRLMYHEPCLTSSFVTEVWTLR